MSPDDILGNLRHDDENRVSRDDLQVMLCDLAEDSTLTMDEAMQVLVDTGCDVKHPALEALFEVEGEGEGEGGRRGH